VSTTRLRNPAHRCRLNGGEHGEIRRCDQCGRLWRYVHPGNPDFAGWRRMTRLNAWLRGVR